MTDYDSMSVKELLEQYVYDAEIRWDDCGQIEAAIRRVVIREASVGTCHIGMGYHLTLDKPSTPDGDYNLVPKETP